MVGARTRTIRDNISSSLQGKLTRFQSDQAVALASNRNNNLSAIRVVAAVSRAHSDPNYQNTITPEMLRTYAQAVEAYASKNGITPSEDGKFSEEQKDPAKMISFFSKELYEMEKGSRKKWISTKNQILETIKEVYPDEGGKSTIPDEINTSINVEKPDMLLSMVEHGDISKEEAVERCQDPADKMTLTNTFAGNNQNALEAQAGRAGTMREPDWGHDKGDDDFKIQDGDIIQYLMKEVILSASAWATNRVTGFAGTFVYELGSGIYHEGLPAYRKARNNIDQWWESLWEDRSLGDEELKKRKTLLEEALGTSNERLDQLPDIERHISHYGLKGEHPEEEEQIEDILRKLEKHYVLFEDDGILYPCNENESINSTDREKSYKDFDIKLPEEQAKIFANFLGKDLDYFTSETVNGETQYNIDGKTHLQYLQSQYDTQRLEEMKLCLPNENPEDLKKWLESYHTAMEERVKTNDDSKIIKMQKENPAYFTALTFGKEIAKYKIQSEQFSIMYSQFMLLEEYRNNPESNILGDPEKLTEFMNKNKNEALAIFHIMHKDRRDPKKGNSVESISSMIETMKKCVEKSDTYLKNGSKEKIENPYKKQKPKNQKKALSIIEAAKEESIGDFLESTRYDLERTEKEFAARYGENSEKRNKVKKMKERLSQKDKDFKKGNHNINLYQHNISGRRK